jgi:hypothetical protein
MLFDHTPEIRGIRYDSSEKSLHNILTLLLEDATDAKNLRAQRHKLELKLSIANDALARSRALQKEAPSVKALQEKVQALEKENQPMDRLQDQTQLLRQQNEVVTSLRDQVQKLQSDALSKVERVRVVPDNQFAQDFRSLVSTIRALSRSVRLPDSADGLQVLQTRILTAEVPQHTWKTRAQKKCLVEAWIWSILI